jgi:two-component system chemotaxis response regulator CheB
MIRVIVIDDSLLMREVISQILREDPEIEVVATAADPHDAREKIKQFNPDVITLDVEMPKMNGIEFLEKIMSLRPMPVIMISTLTQAGAETTIKALEMGAVDCIGKPVNASAFAEVADNIRAKVKMAAQVKVKGRPRASVKPTNATAAKSLHYTGDAKKWLIAIGASTGGVEALREVLAVIPANAPPIVITQHMPSMFTKPFAQRLNGICHITVKEAENGEFVVPGTAYIAYGGEHLVVRRNAGRYQLAFENTDLVSGHKPSVDVLFHSVAEAAGNKAIGGILTGMGRDGARGMLAMRQAGAQTIGESEKTCVVYGMPRAAFELGAVEKEYPLQQIASVLLRRAT